jgi:hypothetical protein
MTIREEIVEKIQQIPENRRPEVFEIIKKIDEEEKKPSLMEQLRAIKIQAPADFAENLDLYMSGEKSFEENIH